jgi:hypothetical protein
MCSMAGTVGCSTRLGVVDAWLGGMVCLEPVVAHLQHMLHRPIVITDAKLVRHHLHLRRPQLLAHRRWQPLHTCT